MKKKKTALVPNNSFTEFLLYTTPNGKVKLEIFLRDETIWLTQEKIAQLFGVQRPAITRQTAAEIVHSWADSEKQNMGLTSWKNAPGGRIRKPDVLIAKNYL